MASSTASQSNQLSPAAVLIVMKEQHIASYSMCYCILVVVNDICCIVYLMCQNNLSGFLCLEWEDAICGYASALKPPELALVM